MDYSVFIDNKTGGKGKLSQIPDILDNNKNGFAYLKKGQQLTGVIVSVGERVTIDFDGHKVTASKDVLKNVTPGERKTFEVVKASKQEIELKLLEGTTTQLSRIIKANMIPDTDWDTLIEKKREEEKQAKKEKEVQETKHKLEEISGKVTGADCKALEQEGFSVENYSVDGLYAAIDRMKGSGAGKENKQSDPSGSTETAARLQEANLPVTAQNLEQIDKALSLSDTITKMDDKAMKYLLLNNAKPTIENIYKAYYSGNAKRQEVSQSLTQEEWTALGDQIKTVIETAGYEVNEDNLKEAGWILENNLPLTQETFSYKKALEEIKSNSSPEKVLDRIIDGMKEGKLPKDVSMADGNPEALKKLLPELQSISPEAVDYAVGNDKELSIRGLTSIQEGMASGKITLSERTGNAQEAASAAAEGTVSNSVVRDSAENAGEAENAENAESAGRDIRYEQLRAHRQLEEIRLKMTLEAAQRLEKKGITVETQKLEQVVEELRRLEDSYYQKLFQEADLQGDEEALQTLKSTTQGIEQLKYMPSYVLGGTLSARDTQTIPGLLEEGAKLQSELAKAGTAYETLMTVPNGEYGDSIRKAFANIDSLLSGMGIENSAENQRAARILGYNSMEITQENIDRVKAYDQQVTNLIKNLHPAVTVRMIKEGINPLNTPIQELNNQIDRIKEEQGISSEDKFSTYLRRLEKEEGITPQERKAYIGVYRLLYNVEKSDGAALGSVIKADREVTLSSLLTAVQTAGRGRLDAVVNDEFGMLTGVSRSKESIAEQLQSFAGSSTAQEIKEEQNQKEIRLKEQTQYLDRILKQITDEISPEKLLQLQQRMAQQSAASGTEQAEVLAGKETSFSSSGVWEKISEIPAEKLLQQLQDLQEIEAADQEHYTRKGEQLRELSKNSEQAIRFLKDYQVTSTPQSILLANHILSNGASPIIRLLKRQNENSNDFTEKHLKENDELSDKLIDKTSMNETYAALEEDSKAIVEQACAQETLDSRRLAELKNVSQQMTFLRKLAEKEFYQIPIETSKGITTMNLTILRGSQNAGKVAATLKSEELGEIKADFSLKDGMLKGFISCDNRAGLDRMKENAAEIGKAAEENNIILKQMDFGIQQKESDTYSYPIPEAPEQQNAVGNDTERMLYRIAKALVQTVRLAEGNVEDTQRAVS